MMFLAGCGSVGPSPAKDNYVADGLVVPPAKSLVVILPIVGEQHDFTKGEVMALGQIRAQLVAAGYRVAALDKANFQNDTEIADAVRLAIAPIVRN